MELKIDPEFETMIPPLTKEEYQQLEENIVSQGRLLAPILVWNNTIIDGHNRYRIVRKHHIPYDLQTVFFHDREEALAWICDNQLGRRNLTPMQKKYLIGMQYRSQKMSKGGDRKSAEKSNDKSCHLKSETTRQRLAKEHQVSEGYIQHCADLAEGMELGEAAAPGFKESILSGKTKLTQKAIELISKVPEEGRAEYIRSAALKPMRSKMEGPASVTNEPLPTLQTSLYAFMNGWGNAMEGHEDWGKNLDNRVEVNYLLGLCRQFLDDFQDQYFSGNYVV